jgi:hypothetical protein
MWEQAADAARGDDGASVAKTTGPSAVGDDSVTVLPFDEQPPRRETLDQGDGGCPRARRSRGMISRPLESPPDDPRARMRRFEAK